MEYSHAITYRYISVRWYENVFEIKTTESNATLLQRSHCFLALSRNFSYFQKLRNRKLSFWNPILVAVYSEKNWNYLRSVRSFGSIYCKHTWQFIVVLKWFILYHICSILKIHLFIILSIYRNIIGILWKVLVTINI